MSQTSSEERSKNYLKQVKGSVVFKLLAVGASFLAIPIMIRYLGQEQFGVWSTLLSLMAWVVFFDLGIGNGLRNKLAESLAKNEKEEASKYVSSGYTLIGLISVIMFTLVAIVSYFVPWQWAFNTKTISEEELRNVVLLTGFVISLNFWIGLINQVLNALQKTSVVVFGQAISNILALLVVYMLSLTTEASLLYLAMCYGFSLIAANILLSLWFYNQHAYLLPKVFLQKDHVKPLLSLGGKFFIIQLAVLVIFTTDKMLITQLFGPAYVTQYDVVFKLFSIITLAYGLISAPLWSAYTDAYHQKDISWINNILQQQYKLFVIILGVAITLIIVAKPLIVIWVGEEVKVSMLLITSMAAFIIVSVWNNIFAFVVNGIGEINLQMKTAIIGMIINIPLSICMVKVAGMGIEGVVWATVISLLPFALLAPIQVRRILKREAYETA